MDICFGVLHGTTAQSLGGYDCVSIRAVWYMAAHGFAFRYMKCAMS